MMVQPILLLLVTASASAYTCSNFFVDLNINAPSYELKFPPFQNHFESVQLLLNTTGRDQFDLVGSPTNRSFDFSIGTSYCTPEKPNGMLQILTHGLGFDRSYWSFGGPRSKYNYIKAATESGYAVISYDRIGNGLSTIPDPYTTVQGPIEAAVLEALTRKIRNGTLNSAVPKPTGKIFHVGHSYGSMLTNALTAQAPSLSDGVVLTGYSTNATYMPIFHANLGYNLARENMPSRFKNFSTGYLTWPNELSYQYGFLHYPYFDPAVLKQSEATKEPYTVGELLVAGPPFNPAQSNDFDKPVLIISGHYDQIFCGGDCDGILQQSAPLFPKAQPFRTHQVPNTGHVLNLQFSALKSFKLIQDFLSGVH